MTTPSSPLPLALFAGGRMVRNAARRKLGRLREPRYFVGFLLGAAYFTMILVRPGGGRGRAMSVSRLPPHAADLSLLVGAAALAVMALLAWLFRRGEPSLGFSEAEIQFLFPAPIGRKALLHYALLKAQLPVFISAMIIAILTGRRANGSSLLTGAGLWLLLTAIHFHNLALAFTKARWEEFPGPARRATKSAAFVLFAGAMGFLVVTFGTALLSKASGFPKGSIPSLADLVDAIRNGPTGTFPLVLLAPFRWILAPLFASNATAFFRALPLALSLIGILYVWVSRTAVRFEEASLAQAAKRADLRARREAGRLGALPSVRLRGRVPFALAPRGRPELAIVWKNLLAWKRASLARQAAVVGSLAAVLFVVSSLVTAPSADVAVMVASTTCLTTAGILALVAPLGLRFDLRGDLEHAAVLRTWPVAAERLVLAELGAPTLIAVFYGWGGIALALSVSAGRAARAAFLGTAAMTLPSTSFGWSGGFVPVALAMAILLPGVVALALVVQNASVLAFPAWFPAGRKRAVGFEQSGLRMLSFIGTSLALVFALVPAAIFGGPVVFFAFKALGLWCLPLAAVLALLPVLAEAAGGVFLLARLFERFDPALDLGS